MNFYAGNMLFLSKPYTPAIANIIHRPSPTGMAFCSISSVVAAPGSNNMVPLVVVGGVPVKLFEKGTANGLLILLIAPPEE